MRLARSRRRLERERAEVSIERLSQDGLDIAVRRDDASDAPAGMQMPASAQVLRFPSPNGRLRD
ncbi:conserved hypothetical protein [Bosea sp. EC-HK365B]|nr:conserved hypothetical protein [Bosea sp. 21B]CAD5281601.1 conserved hypothetical protein [Bosea sp. 7B]VVT57965.1 conserved hypothetical protein [Bosea sp. EC-HK365B]